jgi:hypothetical protein
VCGDADSFAEGSNGHYSCGGVGDDHECVHHAGYCQEPPAVPFDPAMHNAGQICRDKTCVAASIARHRHPVAPAG